MQTLSTTQLAMAILSSPLIGYSCDVRLATATSMDGKPVWYFTLQPCFRHLIAVKLLGLFLRRGRVNSILIIVLDNERRACKF